MNNQDTEKENSAKKENLQNTFSLTEENRQDKEAGQIPEHVPGISGKNKEQILRIRAEELAREIATSELDTERIEVVEFSLAHENYAIELNYIREVYPLKELTPVPLTPPFVLGIINFRGQILSIIDLKQFFDLPDKGLTDSNRIIILHNEEMEFGILADEILGVRFIPTSRIQNNLPTLTGIREEYLKGITKDRVVVLNGEKILTDKKIIVHEEVAG